MQKKRRVEADTNRGCMPFNNIDRIKLKRAGRAFVPQMLEKLCASVKLGVFQLQNRYAPTQTIRIHLFGFQSLCMAFVSRAGQV